MFSAATLPRDLARAHRLPDDHRRNLMTIEAVGPFVKAARFPGIDSDNIQDPGGFGGKALERNFVRVCGYVLVAYGLFFPAD